MEYKFNIDFNVQKPFVLKPTLPKLSTLAFPPLQVKNPFKYGTTKYYNSNLFDSRVSWDNTKKEIEETFKNPSLNLGNNLLATGTKVVANHLTDEISNKLFSDSEIGRAMGNLFSSGLSSAGNTIVDNIVKGDTFFKGLDVNAGKSILGAGTGLAANYLGQGISAIGGNSMLSRGIGLGISTGAGILGGQLVSNGNIAFKGSNLFSDAAGAINPYAFGALIAGSALGAAFGPSNEYKGKYGNITKIMDTTYDAAMASANFIPGAGQGISAAMALNKGLSNIFGSTDGMTRTDAILGSAFMPAPVKWLNMWGSSKTGTFGKLSWLNSEKANTFMLNAFGNLNNKFDLAREEAGKTYGTFSQGAKRDALNNINFANYAWNLILAMADQNELLNIRSQAMTSINNLRYAQLLIGGWNPLARGKQGMKIFNNATNHNIGMRLLSGAALIDNKQMILCSAVD